MLMDLLLFAGVLGLLTHNAFLLLLGAIWLFDMLWEVRYLRRMRMKRGGDGFIYFFTDRGQLLPTVKIGLATDYKQRLASHRTAAPYGLNVYLILRVKNMREAEKKLHQRYRKLRVRGNGEWFYRPIWLRWAMWFASWGYIYMNRAESR